jgi:hypothetical protein
LPPDTYVADVTSSLDVRGSYTQDLTVSTATTVVFRLVADYAVQAAIIKPDQLSAFQNYGSFSGFGGFDKKFGTHYVQLGPGAYYIAVRNADNAVNPFRYELDRNIADGLPTSSSATFTFYDIYAASSNYITSHGYVAQPFTIAAGYRYFLDGASIGITTDVIPAADLQAFESGSQYHYYLDYHTDTPDGPGLVELLLPPGSYDFVAYNSDEVSHPLTYTMERWRVTSTASIHLPGSAPLKEETLLAHTAIGRRSR